MWAKKHEIVNDSVGKHFMYGKGIFVCVCVFLTENDC